MSYTSYNSGPRGTMLPRLRLHGWRQLLVASAPADPVLPYAIDNGAWSAHTTGVRWDPRPFCAMLGAHAAGADWIALPDIVGGGVDSLALSLSWVGCGGGTLELLPVQDGMDPDATGDAVAGAGVGGIFLGGSTAWKLATAWAWGRVARRIGCYLHVARVNTARRIRMCHHIGAHSFDGNSPIMYPPTLEPLTRARDEVTLGLF